MQIKIGTIKYIKYNVNEIEDLDTLNEFLYSKKIITNPIEKIPTTIYFGKSHIEQKNNRYIGFDQDLIKNLIYKDCILSTKQFNTLDVF